MHISAQGRALIEAFEGCMKHVGPDRYTTYKDSVGVLTIGYGHTNLGNVAPHIKAGDVWTKAQCDAALANDMAKFESDVARTMKGFDLNQNQFDALVSFDFNTGHLKASSIDDKLKAGDTDGAMKTLLAYDHAGGQRLKGLTRRRKAERLMFLGRVDEALALADAHVASGQEDVPPADVPRAPIERTTDAPGEAPNATPTMWGSGTVWSTVVGTITSVSYAVGQMIDSVKPLLQDPLVVALVAIGLIGAGGYVLWSRHQKMTLHGV